jgi:hypothetical protein
LVVLATGDPPPATDVVQRASSRARASWRMPRCAPAATGSGITAEPSSSALAVRGANLRLIRVSATELALQFEFANGTD